MSSPQITRMFGRSASDIRLLWSAWGRHPSGRLGGRTSPGSDDSPPVARLHDPPMSRERWMALSFALGSLCFLIGPFPGYVELVGPGADAVTFFVGSVLFTTGGALQLWLSLGGPRAGAWSAAVQFAGTLFFNVTTFMAMHTALSNPEYDRLVWRPDAFGSVCFLVSGAIAYVASPRHGWRPVRGARGWWTPFVNLLGCIFFGVSAIAGYVV